MAFSNVEFASSSPFGCVLRDHNRRDRCRENSKAVSTFQKNLKVLVRGSLNNCVSVSPDSSSDENSWEEQGNGFRNFRFNRINCTQKEKLDENCSSRKNQSLDQWAAKRAKKMVSVIGKPTPEIQPSNSSNLCASSLVRIWEKRLCKPNNINPGFVKANPYSSIDTAFFAEESFSVYGFDESHNKKSNFQSSVDQSFSNSSPHRSNSPKSPKNKNVNIADIVKKLASCDNENKSSGDLRSGDQGEKRVLPQLFSSPRIRGRQAFNDLLMRMERDRHKELHMLINRHAVSKFPQKGRIQSLLRLKLLQRHIVAQQQTPPSTPAKPDIRPPSQRSSIMQLRERFVKCAEQVTTVPSNDVNLKSPQRERACISDQTLDPPLTSQLYSTNNVPQKIHTSEQPSISKEQQSKPCASEDTREKTSPTSDAWEERINFEEHSSPRAIKNAQEETTSSSEEPSVSHGTEDTQEETNPSSGITGEGSKLEECNYEAQESRDSSDFPWPGTSWDSGNMYYEGTADKTMFSCNWDENQVVEEDDYELMESSYDWINDITRPKSYWEDCRQARYREVLNANSNNGEIRQLLERRTVSSFLNSGLRDVIDQIFGSHLQVTRLARIQDEEAGGGTSDQLVYSFHMNERREEVPMAVDGEQTNCKQHLETSKGESGEMVNQIRHPYDESIEDVEMEKVSDVHPMHNHEMTGAKGDGEEAEAEERDRTEYLDQYHGDSDCSDNYPVPTSWNAQDLVASNATSSSNHASVDKEIINELRGQMEQLRQEMLELRETVMDMQRQMQQTLKREVHIVPNNAKNATNKRPRKGRCCICCEMQVDSLLYRCGHMCTCLKCAHELKSNSKKCPICHARIDDVVRAELHTECCL